MNNNTNNTIPAFGINLNMLNFKNIAQKLQKTIDDIKDSVPKNYVRQREHKIIEYKGYWQEFTETNIDTGITRTDKFYVPTSKGRVLHQGTATVVTLEDGSIGRSVCGPEDTYSRKKGLKIAYNRALIQHLEKEIEELGGK
jgi:hypothetical protein